METPEPKGLRLHLGAGATSLPGWLNCDQTKHSTHIDAAFDLEQEWPFQDSCAVMAYASHVLEHLHEAWTFFQELWRVLSPGGHCLLRLPYGGHRSAWGDITHVRRWYPESFAFLQPGYAAVNGNPQHDAWAAPFGINAIDLRLDMKTVRWVRWGLVRRRLQRLVELCPPLAEEMFVDIFPLKSREACEAYQQIRSPQIVPLNYFVYEHVWQRRELQPGEKATMHYLLTPAPVQRMGYS
jgi:SAM-dependent methyltransferase